jgi:sulfur relay (sulfurtransferase) DsrF/TusC family protein
MNEAFLNSYDLEYYLGKVLSDNEINMKMKKYNFLNKYVFKNLFVNEYMDDKEFWITVETIDDEVLDKMVLYKRADIERE